VRLPAHEDPDEYVRRDPEGWRRAVEHALPLIDFLIQAQTANLDLNTPTGKIEAMRRLLPLIAEVSDRKQAEAYGDRLAQKLRLDANVLQGELRELKKRLDREARAHPSRRGEQEGGSEEQPGAPVERLGEKYSASGGAGPGPSYSASGAANGGAVTMGAAGRLLAAQAQEEDCLGLLLERPAAWAEVYGIIADGDFTGTETRAIFAALATAVQTATSSLDLERFLDELPRDLHVVAQRARLQAVEGAVERGMEVARAVVASAYRLKRTRLIEELAELDHLISEAERAGEDELRDALRKRKQQLFSQRLALDRASGLHG
jgi:DNA primase